METETIARTESGRRAYTEGGNTCGTCGRTFANPWGRRTHERMAHGPAVVRRKYKKLGPYKKQEKVQIGPAQQVVVGHKHQDGTAKWCPTCGTNIQAVNLALKIAGEQ